MKRWTMADVVAAQERLGTPLVEAPRPVKILKYRNQTAVYNGRRYGSKLEARYAAHLDLQWRAGGILWYTTQVPFVLEGGVIYRADFLVVETWGAQQADMKPMPSVVTVVDATGVMTGVKRNKLKQVLARYGLTVRIYLRDGSLLPFLDVAVTRKSKPTNNPPAA